MQDFETKRRPAGWRTSEGRMWERAPVREKEGQPHLTGYTPGVDERDKPREAARIGGYYGDAAVGVNRRKDVILLVSKKQSRDGPAATEDEKRLHGDRAVHMNATKQDLITNTTDKSKSAVSYQEEGDRSVSFIMNEFKEMVRDRGQEVLEEHMAFLDQRPELEGMKKLRQEADQLRAEGKSTEEVGAVNRKKEELQQSLTEKKQQERRLKKIIQKAREEAKKMTKFGESNWLTELFDVLTDEPPVPPENPEGEGAGGEDGTPLPEDSDGKNPSAGDENNGMPSAEEVADAVESAKETAAKQGPKKSKV